MGDNSGRETGSAPDRILLVMPPGRDRDLLTEWVSSNDQYRLRVASPTAPLPDDYDLCLASLAAVHALSDALAERKRAADPVFLPHVLLTSEDATRGGSAAVPDGIPTGDDVVDDVLTLPARKAELGRRVENLLRTRRSSLRLAEREDQHRRLLELSPEAVVLVDDDIICYANDSAAALVGATDPGALHDRSIRTFLSPDARETASALAERITADGPGVASDFVDLDLRTLAGNTVPVSVAGVQVCSEGRSVVQLVVRDLSEQKRREQDLALFERAVESAAQGILICDARTDDLPIVYANDGFERITGYTPDEVRGRNCRFLQGANTDPDTVAEIRTALVAGDPVSTDVLNYRKDGTPFWNRLEIMPVEDDCGRLTHFLGLQRDVSDERRRQQQLSVLHRILRHNLRNKMNIVRGYADQVDPADPDTALAVTRIREAATDLLTISEQIREFDAVVSADAHGLERVDLVALARTSMRAAAAATGDPIIPIDGPTNAYVTAHPVLGSALEELFTRVTEAGADSIHVSVTCTGEETSLSVTDCDDAFAVDDLRLLDREVETALEHLDGLDLWLVRWAVEQSSGSFAVETDTDDQSCITLTFTRRAPPAE